MSLWLIIYTAGHIGGVAGPLPYDMAECIIRRDMLRAEQLETLNSGIHHGEQRPATPEELAGLRAISFECEQHAEKPVLGATPT